LHVICLAMHHLHFACACSVLVSPRKFSCDVKACGELLPTADATHAED